MRNYRQYEYKQFLFSPDPVSNEKAIDFLNTLGLEGWDIVWVGEKYVVDPNMPPDTRTGKLFERYQLELIAKRELPGEE